MDPRVASLVAIPSENDSKCYYELLAAAGLGPGLEVRHIDSGLGKGVFATRHFKRDEVLLKEPKLVGAQHTLSKDVALVCSHCSSYVGSIELQIGRRVLSEGIYCNDDLDVCVIANNSKTQECRGNVSENGEGSGDSSEVEPRAWTMSQSNMVQRHNDMDKGEVEDDTREPEGREDKEEDAKVKESNGDNTSMDPCQNWQQIGGQGKDTHGAESPTHRAQENSTTKHSLNTKEGVVQQEDMQVHTERESKEENTENINERGDHIAATGPREIHRQGKSGSAELCELAQSLMDGSLTLPYTDQFKLPAVVGCPGGCGGDVFCSQSCADNAWDSYHSLLCTGPRSHAKSIDALLMFKQHADATNDIFHVASQVIASTLLRAERVRNRVSGKHSQCNIDDMPSPVSNYDGEADPESSLLDDMAVLKEAWEPFAMGHKSVWWEAVACPDGMNKEEEESLRAQLRTIASDSLQLLREALYEERYDPLFSIEVYSRIIGMFEQNNLAVVVASPVEDYFLFIHNLPEMEKAEVEKFTKPLLDALDEGYADFCEGTAFYRLQSCMNHSCVPNARAFKRDEDNDGSAVLLATRDINPDEEIRISYIDETAPLSERRVALRDYGFICSCVKCVREGRLQRNAKKMKMKRASAHSLKKHQSSRLMQTPRTTKQA